MSVCQGAEFMLPVLPDAAYSESALETGQAICSLARKAAAAAFKIPQCIRLWKPSSWQGLHTNYLNPIALEAAEPVFRRRVNPVCLFD